MPNSGRSTPPAPRFASDLRGSRTQRRVALILIFVLGTGGTVWAWWSTMRDSRARSEKTLSVLAHEIHAVLNVRVERHVQALRNLAQFWQLHGLLSEDAWEFNSQMMLGNFRGMEWIAWVNGASGTQRFAAKDSSATLDTRIAAEAMSRVNQPGSEMVYPDASRRSLVLFMPVRTPDDSVGMLVASLSPEKLLGREFLTSGDFISYAIESDSAQIVYEWGTPATAQGPGMAIDMPLPQVFGRMWLVHYRPTEAFMAGSVSTWPNFFLLAGALLSLALGAIAFQFSKLRDYSSALAATNSRLDAQVTELFQRDQTLQKMNDELEARVEARTTQLLEVVTELETFSHSISHDLRSPVGAILNYASILEEDYGKRLDEEGLRLLRRVQAGGQSAIRLLDQLVEFVWMGREDTERTQVDMTEIARDAYSEVVVGSEDARDVEFQLQSLPPASGNAALLGRVFRNLLSNALKYTRGRELRRIAVTGETRGSENVYVVSDNGIGFDAAQGQAVFEPFRRLHTAKEYEGAGLGLAIVAKIVRKHGGRVWAESSEDGGATFGFALPHMGETA